MTETYDDDGPTISSTLSDEIHMWRRIVLGATDETVLDLFRRAATEIWNAVDNDRGFYPDLADVSVEVVADALTNLGTAVGIPIDDVQHIISTEKDPAQRSNGRTDTNGAAHTTGYGKALPFVLFDDIKVEPKDWLAENFLGAGEFSCWYGEPGTGKSVLIQDFALHVAAGMAWLGRKVKQGAVLYIALERFALVKRRAIAFKIKHNVRGLPFAVIGGVYDFRNKKTADAIIQIVKALEQQINQKVTLIIIDTLNRALCGGDENGPDMGAFVATVGRIHEATGAHHAAVHHPPHDGARMRGHGALPGAIDTGIYVIKGGDGGRAATITKANDAEEGERVTFTLESVTVCKIGDTTTTAPVIVPSAQEPIAKDAKPKAKLNASATLALRLLHKALIDAGTIPPSNNHIPADTRATTISLWRSYCYAGTVSESDKPDSKKKAFGRAVETLQAAGLVGVWNDHVWSTGTRRDKNGMSPEGTSGT